MYYMIEPNYSKSGLGGFGQEAAFLAEHRNPIATSSQPDARRNFVYHRPKLRLIAAWPCIAIAAFRDAYRA